MESEVSVLVVGGGVAGLAAATTLVGYGVDVLLIEQRSVPTPLPRATVISTRSMEVLRGWGLADETLAGGVDAEVLLWECETLANAAQGTAWEVGYPTRAQAAVLSPCAPAVVPQDWLETVLRRRMLTLPTGRLLTGTQLVAVHNTVDGVRATVCNTAGDTHTIRCRYLVAADGAHSAVRHILGVRTHGSGEALGGVQVVFRAPLGQLVGSPQYVLYSVTTPGATGSFLPAGRGDRWIHGWFSDGDADDELLPERVMERIRRGAGVPDLLPQIEHVGRFQSSAEVASRFRVGNVFLVGDAAHRVTPRGGTGMNMALQSGYDLGWKLGWELHGWAGSDLLASYEQERKIVAEHNATRSIDSSGTRRPVLDELAIDLGGRLRHVWVGSGAVSSLDLLGPGFTVFTGPEAARLPELGSLSSSAPRAVVPLDPAAARALGIGAGGALLARPDGVPIALWTATAQQDALDVA